MPSEKLFLLSKTAGRCGEYINNPHKKFDDMFKKELNEIYDCYKDLRPTFVSRDPYLHACINLCIGLHQKEHQKDSKPFIQWLSTFHNQHVPTVQECMQDYDRIIQECEQSPSHEMQEAGKKLVTVKNIAEKSSVSLESGIVGTHLILTALGITAGVALNLEKKPDLMAAIQERIEKWCKRAKLGVQLEQWSLSLSSDNQISDVLTGNMPFHTTTQKKMSIFHKGIVNIDKLRTQEPKFFNHMMKGNVRSLLELRDMVIVVPSHSTLAEEFAGLIGIVRISDQSPSYKKGHVGLEGDLLNLKHRAEAGEFVRNLRPPMELVGDPETIVDEIVCCFYKLVASDLVSRNQKMMTGY